MTASQIEVNNKELTEFCRRNSVRRLSLFGPLTERFFGIQRCGRVGGVPA